MTLLLLLEMMASAFGDRIAFGTRDAGLSYRRLHDRAGAGAAYLRSVGAGHVAFIGESSAALPVALFAAAWAGVPLLPLNYRLGRQQLRSLVDRHADIVVVADQDVIGGLDGRGQAMLSVDEWTSICGGADGDPPEPSTTDGDEVAVLLYTSGTTSEPKAVVLRHRHLTSYVISSVEFAGADPAEAALVSVPPYHVAGVATILSNVYAGRRVVYLPSFTPEGWLDLVRREEITTAMVVPTMLARIVDHLGTAASSETPTLRTLAYGGARTPVGVVERALHLFGAGTDFVNAYGLTETSSTIAVLGPDDHRVAMDGDRALLASAGRLNPGVEVAVRDGAGVDLPAGEVGEIWVRGEQVSGEYLGHGGSLDDHGWFPTRDRGRVDADGYLFVEGRSDDTIIRGGENVAPAEIEDVLLEHPAVREVAVVGVPDEEWGERIAAAIVLHDEADVSADELREWVRERLRSSKTPDVVGFLDELPVTETGKLLRRVVRRDLIAAHSGD
jgi:acyl-CoA synthetase (AMP-forming)/AMP-acid ligase II